MSKAIVWARLVVQLDAAVAWWLFIGWVGNIDYGAPPTYSGNEKHAVQTFTAGGGGGGGGGVGVGGGGGVQSVYGGEGGGGAVRLRRGGNRLRRGGGGGQSASGPIPLFGTRYR